MFFVLISVYARAQWPGYYYAFVLEDTNGNIIDSSDHSYLMEPKAGSDSFKVLLNIEMCEDIKTWKYYEGYKDFDKVNYLKINKAGDTEAMIIEFPPSLSAGKDRYYRNLFLGIIKFKRGVYKVRLPQTDDEWDSLKQIKLCSDPYNENRFFDISDFQK